MRKHLNSQQPELKQRNVRSPKLNITVLKKTMHCRLANTIGTVECLSTVANFNPSV